jgi:DNA-binding NarL/FixJ family response regulator
MRPVRVLVADDQKVVRDGLCLMLGLHGIEVAGAAVGGTDAVREAVAAVPGVVLMDLQMPNCDGVEATRLIVRQQPHVRVVVLTAFSDDDPVFAALRAGVLGLCGRKLALRPAPRRRRGWGAGDSCISRPRFGRTTG